MAREQWQLGEALLDALVRVAESLLQPQYLLADDREPEMTRLDDAGMHWADRYFVHAVAGHAHELVIIRRHGIAGRAVTGLCQRVLVRRPGAMAQPWPLIRGVGAQAAKVECGALHALGRRVQLLQPAIELAAFRERQFQHQQSVTDLQCGAHHRRCRGASGCGPQRQQLCAHGRGITGDLQPLLVIDRQPADRRRTGDRQRLFPPPLRLHDQRPPINWAASRYQSAR
jgi:hypothetical protein